LISLANVNLTDNHDMWVCFLCIWWFFVAVFLPFSYICAYKCTCIHGIYICSFSGIIYYLIYN